MDEKYPIVIRFKDGKQEVHIHTTLIEQVENYMKERSVQDVALCVRQGTPLDIVEIVPDEVE